MNDEEFCALYEAHARRLWAYVARATRDAAVADDIVQDAFVTVFGAKSMETADSEHRRHYLYKVATNLIRRRYRRPVETHLGESSSASGAISLDEKLAVEQALNALSDVERQALWLGYVEGWSWREVARMLGYREGSVRQLAVRAKRRFRDAFGLNRAGGVDD
jgi:RNA polymerase sigma-70 factor (ECF subfamily)